MITSEIPQIVAFILAATPLNLFIIKKINKFIFKNHPKIGQTTTICTNITGNLTEKYLIVRSVLFDRFKLTAEDHSDLIKIEDQQAKTEILIEKIALQKDDFIQLMAICSNVCHFKKIQDLEYVMLKFFQKCGFNGHKINKEYEQIANIPSSEDKKISTTVVIKNDTKEIFSFSKGHPEKILEKCSRILLNNTKIDLDANIRRKIKKEIERLENNGQKIIGFSYKGLPLKRFDNYTESFAENEMTFIGMLGLTNAIKKDILTSTEKATNAGIKTYVISDVKEKKAIALAQILKLVNPQYFESITGSYLEDISDHKLDKMLGNKEKDFVFSQLSEPQKMRIMNILRKHGETVAISDVHNQYKDIVESIEKGRLSNKNYIKYTRHTLSLKFAEIAIFLFAVLIKAPLPLTITSLLLIEIFVNLGLGLSLKQDKTEIDVMNKNFNPSINKIFTKKNLRPMFIDTLVISIFAGALYVFNLVRFGWVQNETLLQTDNAYLKATTITFSFLVIYQIIKSFYLTSHKNSYLLLTSIITALCAYTMINFEFLSNKIGFTSLETIDYQILGFYALIVIIIEHLRK
ncbi:hypothetical protein COU74_01635 [Candidatus Peregrinibacteria bacterium CG10_big_fil_rev_8_21_14_0_10_36_19]|nr:MAG: hypothetical protein COU74_01635 [Candidatus Peregrinibacteria bacterium CG10_big_fil_rev_8_21_14_0_10_36_19]